MPFLAFKILKWAVKLLSAVIVGVFVFVVVSVAQVLSASQASQSPSAVHVAPAIVVMGEPTPGGVASVDLVSRLEQALSLYRAGRARTIVVTGGASPGSPLTEAAVAQKFLEQQGLQASDVVAVGGSSDPASLSLVAARYPHAAVIIVADPLDGLRLRATAASDGLDPEFSPATPPSESFWTDVRAVWKQASAVAEGRVLGFGSTGWASS